MNRLIVLAAMVVACAEPKPTLDDVGPRLGRASCEQRERCSGFDLDCEDAVGFTLRAIGAAPGIGVPGQPPVVTNLNTWDALIASAKAGAVRLDSDEAAACLAWLQSDACEALDSVSDAARACERMWVPTLAEGARCIATEACAAGLACVAGEETCGATCRPVEGCLRHLDCAEGSICDAGTCGPVRSPGAVSQPCGTLGACEPGLFCDFTVDGGTMRTVCAPIRGEGEVCLSAGSLGAEPCEDGLSCRAGTGGNWICLRTIADGGACDRDAVCASTWCVDGTCRALPSSGPCAKGVACDYASAWCDASTETPTCRPFAGVGGACRETKECSSDLGIVCDAAPGFEGTCVRREDTIERVICEP